MDPAAERFRELAWQAAQSCLDDMICSSDSEDDAEEGAQATDALMPPFLDTVKDPAAGLFAGRALLVPARARPLVPMRDAGSERAFHNAAESRRVHV